MPQFSAHIRREHSGIGIVEIEGYIHAEGGKEILETCDLLLGEGVRHLILNLERCRIINSVGVMCLLELIEKIDRTESHVCFCCATPTLAMTFRIMCLFEMSTLYDTEREAVQAMEDLI